MLATTLMYIGLNMTYASSFQMLRGSVIVFTGLLSIGFLNKKLASREWTGISLVIIGLLLVGISDISTISNQKGNDKNSILTGDLLIITAQVKLIFKSCIIIKHGFGYKKLNTYYDYRSSQQYKWLWRKSLLQVKIYQLYKR